MKREYSTPCMMIENFNTDAFCADEACGTGHTVYNFKCNAGSKYSNYNVYLSDGTPYATSGKDSGGCKTDYVSYSPCGDTHKADSKSIFLDGYMYVQNYYGNNTGSKIKVIIWTDNYTNVHCTTDLNMNSWTTAKS